MFVIQLFDENDDRHPIDARLVRDGILTIGRDSDAGWTIADPDCELSRTHCELAVVDDVLELRALGRNGVFDASDGARFPDDVAVPLTMPATLRLGRYLLKSIRETKDQSGCDLTKTMVLTPPLGSSTAIPRDWIDASPSPASSSGSLLDAFCDGAGLDVSMLATQDSTEIMRRAGAIYRQMILGIGDLMAEREQAREQYRMTCTTIGSANNNPFKWAPTQRLAVDLLLGEKGSFLSGADALKSSFCDIKRHLIATFAGLHGTLRAAIAAFDPSVIGRSAPERSLFLKTRTSAIMDQVARVHDDLQRQIEGGEVGSLERAFVEAYHQIEMQDCQVADS